MRMGKTTAKSIIECVKTIDKLSIGTQDKVTSEKLHEYLRMSFEYVNDAIEIAILLNFVSKEETLTVTYEGQKLIKSKPKQTRFIFYEQLEKLPLIKELKKLILEGFKLNAAVSKIIEIFNIQGSEKEILYTIKNLIKFANLKM
jgi:hypothetical protein